MITIIIPGEPVAKGRPRITTVGGHARAFTPAKTARAESTIALFASQAMAGRPLLQGALQVEVIAYRSKGMPGKPDARLGTKARDQWEAAEAGALCPTSKPDADNYGKAALDALNSVVFVDDSQVVDLTLRKRFSSQPRLVIRVTAYEP